jgi:hypothetical protein
MVLPAFYKILSLFEVGAKWRLASIYERYYHLGQPPATGGCPLRGCRIQSQRSKSESMRARTM